MCLKQIYRELDMDNSIPRTKSTPPDHYTLHTHTHTAGGHSFWLINSIQGTEVCFTFILHQMLVLENSLPQPCQCRNRVCLRHLFTAANIYGKESITVSAKLLSSTKQLKKKHNNNRGMKGNVILPINSCCSSLCDISHMAWCSITVN